MRLRTRLFRLAKHLISQRNLLSYRLHGRRPWSKGYFEYKWARITKALGNARIIAAFRSGGTLPTHFGRGVDERIVEFPWVIANMPTGAGKLLDAGSALNFEPLLSHDALTEKKITIVTLNPESNCFWQRGVSYVFDDMRQLPFPSDSFDVVTCISTLEHVGMDNTEIYTADSRYKENASEDYLIAVAELRRVLKTGGVLLLTVPYGVHRHFSFFQQFNKNMLDKVLSVFGADKCTVDFYAYTNGGWQPSSADECASAQYVTADRAKTNPSLAVAASAVACVRLTK